MSSPKYNVDVKDNVEQILKNSSGIDELKNIIMLMKHKIDLQSQKIEYLLKENSNQRKNRYREACDLVRQEHVYSQQRDRERIERVRSRSNREYEREYEVSEPGFVTPPPVRKRGLEPVEPPVIHGKQGCNAYPYGTVKKRISF